MIEIRLDRGTCQGYGNCVLVAPDLFELDEEALGVVRRARVDDGEREAVRTAVYDCPTDSISFVELADEPGDG